jgi:hypothetical protein
VNNTKIILKQNGVEGHILTDNGLSRERLERELTERAIKPELKSHEHRQKEEERIQDVRLLQDSTGEE